MNSRHLFLTSNGLTEGMKSMFFDIIGKRPEKIKILYIPTAAIETDGARKGIALCLYELSLMGISNVFVYNLELILSKGYVRTYSAQVPDINMVSRLIRPEEMRQFDAAFVSGGDCGVLCREMVRTGFDRVLEMAINDGLTYVGVSAGSMYAAGNLEDGLRVIPNPIIPHWDGAKMEALPAGGGEILLADGQAVYIDGENVSLI